MIKSIIVATTVNHVIGKDGKLPWHLPADMKYFKRITHGHHVIMGRKTFESLPGPLPGRKLIVLSHDPNYQADGCQVATNFNAALRIAREANETEVFIAGGSNIYEQALIGADKIYLTLVRAKVEGDTFFPELDAHSWLEVNRSSHIPDDNNPYPCDFIEYVRRA